MMTSRNYQLIRNAIEHKEIITADYDGYKRIMCPHVIGTKNGTEQALCYQFGGASRTDGEITLENANWRCIVISKLSNVTSHQGEWHTGQNHSRPQTCVDVIDLEVDL